MKTTKLVVGIISIVLCFLVGLQSCAAGLGNALESNGEIGGTAGLILAISLLIAGIVAICTRNGGKGGYVSTTFYVLAGLIGLLCAGSYSDLNIWSVVSLIFGGICAIATRKQK